MDLTHVWKSLLSGQIISGKTDMHLTSDYAYDLGNDFREGWEVNLQEFAKKIIEDPSGWWVSVDEKNDTTIQLSVNCCQFDYKTFIFSREDIASDEQEDIIPGEQEKTAKTGKEERKATKKQLWALHCATRLNTKDLDISFDRAKELIGKSKDGVDIKLAVKTMLN